MPLFEIRNNCCTIASTDILYLREDPSFFFSQLLLTMKNYTLTTDTWWLSSPALCPFQWLVVLFHQRLLQNSLCTTMSLFKWVLENRNKSTSVIYHGWICFSILSCVFLFEWLLHCYDFCTVLSWKFEDVFLHNSCLLISVHINLFYIASEVLFLLPCVKFL